MARTRKPRKGIKVKRGISGLGLFAERKIPKDAFIVEYTGPLLTAEEADKRGGKYLFEIDEDWTIDGSSRDNLARYINHSCKPNAEVEAITDERRLLVHALRDIQPGEEVTIDYGEEYFDDHIRPHGCRCDHCRKKAAKKTRTV